jgi:Putative Na+/H+ antiporter
VLQLLATAAGVPLPPSLDLYPAQPGAGLVEVLSARARLVPFNLAATVVFLLAVLHTFMAQRFMRLAHRIQERRDAQARAAGREPAASIRAKLMHFVGEVEVVFGLWAVVLVAVIVAFYDWPTAVHYLDGGVNFTEALFVVMIMALASSRPVLALAERALAQVAAVGGATPAALLVGFFLASLVVHGGLLGWWIAPILAKLTAVPLFLGAGVLTAFNDNALMTYLATLVPGLSDAGRYAIVAGAVAGGGLTVIATPRTPPASRSCRPASKAASCRSTCWPARACPRSSS